MALSPSFWSNTLMKDTVNRTANAEDLQIRRQRLARLLGRLLADVWIRERRRSEPKHNPVGEQKKSEFSDISEVGPRGSVP
jgi:hypothetical protein